MLALLTKPANFHPDNYAMDSADTNLTRHSNETPLTPASAVQIAATTKEVPAEVAGQVLKKANSAEPDEAVKELFQLFLNDPDFRKRVLEEQAKDRKKGPYYSKEYGEAIKPTIDRLIADEAKGIVKNYRIPYEQFPGKQKETIRQRIEQSIRYLVAMMDDANHTYFNWRQRVEIKKTHSCILIEWKVNARQDAIPLQGEYEEENKIQRNEWEVALDTFLTTAKHRDAFEKQVDLSDDAVLRLKLSLDQLNTSPGQPWTHIITNNRIKIVKWSP